MKIYAIRDRLVDYFLTPFAAHEDKGVLNSIANLVNKEDANDPVAQAPHHFEVWRLAKVDEQGHIVPDREFLADCSTLLRARRPTTGPGSTAIPLAPSGRTTPPSDTYGGTDPNQRFTALQTQGSDLPGPTGPVSTR